MSDQVSTHLLVKTNMCRLFTSIITFFATIVTASPFHAPSIGCFPQSQILTPAVFAECIRVIDLIPTIRPNPRLPLTFSANRADRPDISLPTFWQNTGQRCVVGVRLKDGAQGYDRLSLNDLRDWAKEVALKASSKDTGCL